MASADEETRQSVSSMGGQAAQESGQAHELTEEERSRGGSESGGNFANRDTEDVREAGRRGGEASRSGEEGMGEDWEEGEQQ